MEKEIIKNAIQIIQEVKVKDSLSWIEDWMFSNGYDRDADLRMRKYFKTIEPIDDAELKQTLVDLWNANYEFIMTLNEDSPRIYYSQEELDKVIDKAKRNSARLNKPAPRMRYILLDFSDTEKELDTMTDCGSKEYRGLISKLLQKYSVKVI